MLTRDSASMRFQPLVPIGASSVRPVVLPRVCLQSHAERVIAGVSASALERVARRHGFSAAPWCVQLAVNIDPAAPIAGASSPAPRVAAARPLPEEDPALAEAATAIAHALYNPKRKIIEFEQLLVIVHAALVRAECQRDGAAVACARVRDALTRLRHRLPTGASTYQRDYLSVHMLEDLGALPAWPSVDEFEHIITAAIRAYEANRIRIICEHVARKLHQHNAPLEVSTYVARLLVIHLGNQYPSEELMQEFITLAQSPRFYHLERFFRLVLGDPLYRMATHNAQNDRELKVVLRAMRDQILSPNFEFDLHAIAFEIESALCRFPLSIG